MRRTGYFTLVVCPLSLPSRSESDQPVDVLAAKVPPVEFDGVAQESLYVRPWSYAKAYSVPSTDTMLEFEIDRGEKVLVVGVEGSWYKVRNPEGDVGYSPSSDLRS